MFGNATRLGVGGARHSGVDASSGQFLTFLDDDDIRLPGSLDLQIRTLQENPMAALSYGLVHRGSADLSLTRGTLPPKCIVGDVFWELLHDNFIPSISAVFRRSAFAAVGGLRAGLAPSDDWDLWVRIAERFPVTCVEVPVAVWRESTLESGQGSSKAVGGILESSIKAYCALATLSRVQTDGRRFRLAESAHRSAMIDRLLRETVEALCHRDLYAASSLKASVMLSPGGVICRLLQARYWRYAIATLRGLPRGTAGTGLAAEKYASAL